MFFLCLTFLRSTTRLKTHYMNLFPNPVHKMACNYRYNSQQPPTLYTVLGLEPGATDEEIKKAYYSMSKMYHPDRNMGNETATTKILEVNEAFEVLGNKDEREKYDKKMFPALHINKPKKHFIYEHTEYYDAPLPQKTMYKKPSHISCTWEQYKRHTKGERKRQQKHLSQKVSYSKSMSCKLQTKIGR